jgi:hypothetical protein
MDGSAETSVSAAPLLSMASAMSRIGAAMSAFDRLERGTAVVVIGKSGMRLLSGMVNPHWASGAR